jgi:hypothetical protein
VLGCTKSALDIDGNKIPEHKYIDREELSFFLN